MGCWVGHCSELSTGGFPSLLSAIPSAPIGSQTIKIFRRPSARTMLSRQLAHRSTRSDTEMKTTITLVRASSI